MLRNILNAFYTFSIVAMFAFLLLIAGTSTGLAILGIAITQGLNIPLLVVLSMLVAIGIKVYI